MAFLENTDRQPTADTKNQTNPPAGQLEQVCDRRFELGMYAYHRGDYSKALVDFEMACETATALRDHERYVKSCAKLLRILAEREEFAKIEKIEKNVISVLTSEAGKNLDLKTKSHAHYVLGICSCYQDGKHDLAMRRFHEAIDLALMSEDRKSLAGPLYGAATVYYAKGRYEDSLRELDRLTTLLSCIDLPDLHSATHILKAMVLRNQNYLDAALESAWKAFEALKHHPHLVLYLHTLWVLGTIFQMKGDLASAGLYLDLAERSLKKEEFPRVARLIKEASAELGRAPQTPPADLIFDNNTGVLLEKNKGEIRFDGQFILRDLLRAFLQNPGKVFSKENLVRDVWREAYDPRIHDNKIYVTIKRLRALIESPDNASGGSNEYILRAKAGYCLNPNTRVLIIDRKSDQQPLPEKK
jgi:tetratricopeptide (TPR) repeat protein/DNA-binding winged helix-turn-helix (wHTH) protein